MSAEPMPFASKTTGHVYTDFTTVKCTVHNWNLFILCDQGLALYCSLDALLVTAKSEPFELTSSAWRKFKVPSLSRFIFTFGNHIITAGSIDPKAVAHRVTYNKIERIPKILPTYSNMDPICGFAIPYHHTIQHHVRARIAAPFPTRGAAVNNMG